MLSVLVKKIFDLLVIVLDKTFLTNKYNLPVWDEDLKKKLLSG